MLNLVKKLMVYDLQSLDHSKSIPETLGSVTAELHKEKTGPMKEAKRK